MDATDLGIIRAIGIEPFAGLTRDARPWRPEVLADALKISPRLAKDRLARLEREGFVVGFDIQPNLGLLGLKGRTYAFEVPTRSDRRARLDALLSIEGVMGLVDYVSGWLTVTFTYRDASEHDSRLALVRERLGGAEPITWFESEEPKPAHAPTPLDWRILRALRGDARKPIHELAEAVGVSTKTVQRRLDRLAAEGAFSTFVRLDERFHDEVLLCSLVVRVEHARAYEAIHALHAGLLADAWARCGAPPLQGDVHYDLVAAPRTPRGLADLLEETARLPGVLEVQGHLAARTVFTLAWIDAAMEGRLDAPRP